MRDCIREECMKVDILKGYVSKDHVHLLLSIPPQIAISRLVQKLKGKSSFKALSQFEHLKKHFGVVIYGPEATLSIVVATLRMK